MTPTTPPNKRQSGNPATQAKIQQSVKHQREEQKREKLAEYERQLARRRRGRFTWWVVGSAAALAVVALVAASVIFAPPGAPDYSGQASGARIDGVETFSNETRHVEGTVDYPQNPPAGGPHNQFWLNCAVYDEPQQNENAVHSLEHGAVWVTYDRTQVSGDELDRLRALMPSSYALLSPHEGLPSPIVLSAWNAQLKVQDASDPRITAFFQEYWRSQSVPEPGAPCTGGIDGPGKRS
ncbi:DUF3105 domain-containing protein [Microbacterium dextranolyticum]|uniref:Membrane protein n=1 Tax=Microbacterium dextranolyticum TaxID=36806 RepID=A0A9W6HKH6_9MICO|nr:DUF3105 domain-containing protein [Microbacterium dextranolyticum]MBM7462245.1 hypothetical protein [Microbacterium dextranolyticum]GLJ94497.1 membrane protein [Microbacterium dextranolyticum]